MAERIETARLSLRRFTLTDAPALFALMSDAETMRYWSCLPHRTIAETEAYLAETIAAVEDGRGDDFAVTLAGMLIGKAGLWRGGEIGFLLDRAQWGRGFASEAVRAVIGRAFARGATTITADVDPRNARSLAMLGRLGFRPTSEAKATFRLGDEWVDSVYLTLHRRDYGT
ncbi:GNAT family N-acetyltransferase [Acidisoma sp. C75]